MSRYNWKSEARRANYVANIVGSAQSHFDAPVYPLGVYLAAVAEVLRTKFNNIVTVERNAEFKANCASDAFQLVVKNKDGDHEFAVEDWVTAAEAVAWMLEKDVRPGFETDLQAALSYTDIPQNKMRLVMYVVKMYLEEAAKVEANADFASSSHMSVEGGKLCLSVQIDSSDYSSSEWGVSYFTKAHTEDGNVVVWYAKTEQTVGTIVDINGKVKAHKVWKGVNVTVLNFVKVL